MILKTVETLGEFKHDCLLLLMGQTWPPSVVVVLGRNWVVTISSMASRSSFGSLVFRSEIFSFEVRIAIRKTLLLMAVLESSIETEITQVSQAEIHMPLRRRSHRLGASLNVMMQKCLLSYQDCCLDQVSLGKQR
jgi:hypothetical protein